MPLCYYVTPQYHGGLVMYAPTPQHSTMAVMSRWLLRHAAVLWQPRPCDSQVDVDGSKDLEEEANPTDSEEERKRRSGSSETEETTPHDDNAAVRMSGSMKGWSG